LTRNHSVTLARKLANAAIKKGASILSNINRLLSLWPFVATLE